MRGFCFPCRGSCLGGYGFLACCDCVGAGLTINPSVGGPSHRNRSGHRHSARGVAPRKDAGCARNAASRFARGLLQWKPGPDRWSVSEVLAHLADLEQVYSERVRRMIAENSPALERYDQVGASAAGAYSRGSALEPLERFAPPRRAIVASLKSVPASAGAPTAKHSEHGVITLSQMLHEWASHDLGHINPKP
jgi:DinB superfamily